MRRARLGRAPSKPKRAPVCWLTSWRGRAAKKAAEQSVRAHIEREQGAERATDTKVQELESRLTEQRRAGDAAAQSARAEVTKEQAARKEAQRVTSLTQQELAREREAKQRAEIAARTANERLAQEREARQVAERAANEARKKLAKTGEESVPAKTKAKANEVPCVTSIVGPHGGAQLY